MSTGKPGATGLPFGSNVQGGKDSHLSNDSTRSLVSPPKKGRATKNVSVQHKLAVHPPSFARAHWTLDAKGIKIVPVAHALYVSQYRNASIVEGGVDVNVELELSIDMRVLGLPPPDTKAARKRTKNGRNGNWGKVEEKARFVFLLHVACLSQPPPRAITRADDGEGCLPSC